MEALIHQFKLATEGFNVPAGESYAAVEAPKGELGYYIVSNGGGPKPYRLKIRGPSFSQYFSAAPVMSEGQWFADMVSIHRVHRHYHGRSGSVRPARRNW